MKKLYFASFLLMAFAFTSAARPIEGFQKAKFGSSYKEVKKIFGKATPLKKSGVTQYSGLAPLEFAGKKGTLLLRFMNDKLYQVIATFPISSLAKNAGESEFIRVQKLLIESYGPFKSEDKPRSSMGSNDTTEAEISLGVMKWLSNWEDINNKSAIQLQLAGEKLQSRINILYTDIAKQEEVDKATKAKEASEL